MKTLEAIVRTARREFQNRLRMEGSVNAEAVALDVAKNSVPSSSKEILLLAARNLDLALEEPSKGIAFDGRRTAINLIASNIRDAIFQNLTAPEKTTEAPQTDSMDIYGALIEHLSRASDAGEMERTYDELLQQMKQFRESFYTENLYQTVEQEWKGYKS